MSRPPVQTTPLLAVLLLFTAPAWMIAGPKEPDAAPGDEAARDVLSRIDKHWKPYTNEPNLDDFRWKIKMEALVRLAQAGPAAFPLLEEAAKKDTKWSESTREFAEGSLPMLRKDEVRKALADYGLAQMDSAHIGKSAPDFTLKDATGKTHSLSQFRDNKIVVLAFLIQDT